MRQNSCPPCTMHHAPWDFTLYTNYLIESKFIDSNSEAASCGTYFKWDHSSGINLNGTKD